MPQGLERSELRVEGTDDFHAIISLLVRNGFDYDKRPWPREFPKLVKTEGVDKLLKGIPTAIQTSTDRSVGFVLDADSPLIDRWRAVRGRLADVGVDTPDVPPPGGFVGESRDFKTRVGVWLMPDNEQDGQLETFLRTLIDGPDPLISHAESATDQARKLGAQFADKDHHKAVLHAWLAWQERPGCPYGTAIREQSFQHDSPAAERFVAWFRTLYGIAD